MHKAMGLGVGLCVCTSGLLKITVVSGLGEVQSCPCVRNLKHKMVHLCRVLAGCSICGCCCWCDCGGGIVNEDHIVVSKNMEMYGFLRIPGVRIAAVVHRGTTGDPLLGGWIIEIKKGGQERVHLCSIAFALVYFGGWSYRVYRASIGHSGSVGELAWKVATLSFVVCDFFILLTMDLRSSYGRGCVGDGFW